MVKVVSKPPPSKKEGRPANMAAEASSSTTTPATHLILDPSVPKCPVVNLVPPVGLPNLGNTCFMNGGMQMVWRALVDYFLTSITIHAKKLSNSGNTMTSSSSTTSGAAAAAAAVDQGPPSTAAVNTLVDSRVALLRSKLMAMSNTNGTPLGTLVAKTILKRISVMEESARDGGMYGVGGDDEEGRKSAGVVGGDSSVGLLTIMGELFLRDAISVLPPAGKKSGGGAAKSARINAIKGMLASENERFVDWDQHDSHELVMCLLNALSTRFNSGSGVMGSSYEMIDERKRGEGEEDAARRWWRKVCGKEDSFVTNLFRCLTRTKTVCGQCSNVSLNFDPTMELQISLTEENLKKATDRRRERIAISKGLPVPVDQNAGARNMKGCLTALQQMQRQLDLVRQGSGGGGVRTSQDEGEEEEQPTVAATSAFEKDASDEQNDDGDDKDGSGGEGAKKDEDDGESHDDEVEEDENIPKPAAANSTKPLSAKERRAAKKAEKAKEKHERDLKKLKRNEGKKQSGSKKKGKNAASPAASWRQQNDDDEDDNADTIFLEDLLYTQLRTTTEVEGFRCEKCGAVSASTPSQQQHQTSSSSSSSSKPGKKGGNKGNAAAYSKKAKREAASESVAAASSPSAVAAAASSSSSGTTTIITHEHTHYPPFLLVHLLRFDYNGDKIRVPVKLSTTSDQILRPPSTSTTSAATMTPTVSAMLALPPRASTLQLGMPDGGTKWGEPQTEEEEEEDDVSLSSSSTQNVSNPNAKFKLLPPHLESIYEVVGVVRHHGRSLSYGHYTSSVKGIDFFDLPTGVKGGGGGGGGPAAGSKGSKEEDEDDPTAQWYLCDDDSISSEKLGRSDRSSTVCWKGGDRDAYMVLLRSIRYSEQANVSPTTGDDDQLVAAAQEEDEAAASSENVVGSRSPTSHL